MKNKAWREKVLYAATIAFSILLLSFFICCTWIGYEVKQTCNDAKEEYGGDCIGALTALLDDESQGFRDRNDATWALGQLGDERALESLKKHYSGVIPPREPLNKTLSQYELRKAIRLTSGGTNPLAWIWRGMLFDDRPQSREMHLETVVVSSPDDPYYALARKISEKEDLPIVPTIAEILPLAPRYVLYVASPQAINRETLEKIGEIFLRNDYYPGLGFISGSTLLNAERLWGLRTEARAGRNFVGGDVEEVQRVMKPTIFDISEEPVRETDLNKGNLISALKSADYFYWARHVAGTNWFWNGEAPDFGEQYELFDHDIPLLKPAVIYSPSCGSFRPWLKDSIAVGFIDRGAAAYLGNVNSPSSNAFIKHGLAVPGISSWSQFPLGLVAQVQNRSTTHAVFNAPQFFMLGDPLIALSAEKPYRILSDETDAYGHRRLEGESDFRGILALKIDDASTYKFVNVDGLTSVSDNDVFYNSKLQTMNLGNDKYLLMHHAGGLFRIDLYRMLPFLWEPADALLDALDFAWVVLWMDVKIINTAVVSCISLIVFTLVMLNRTLRRKKSPGDVRIIFAVAFAFTAFRLGYFLLRQDAYTVSANYVQFGPLHLLLACAGDFAGMSAGLILMKDARNAMGKILGLLVAVLPRFLMTAFFLAFITLMNNATAVNGMTASSLWNYRLFWMLFVVLVLEAALVYGLHRLVVRRSAPTAAG